MSSAAVVTTTAATPTTLTPEAQHALIHSVRALTWRIAHRLHARNPGVDLDDIHAAVTHGVVKAAAAFAPARGNKFVTYAYPAGWNEGVEFCRQEYARGFRIPRGGKVYWSPGEMFAVGHDPGGDDAAVVDVADHREGADAAEAAARTPWESAAAFWEVATSGLTSRERDAVLMVWRDGRMQVEAAERMGVGKERVRQLLGAAAERMRRSGVLSVWAQEVA